jgi:hypothetical protein
LTFPCLLTWGGCRRRRRHIARRPSWRRRWSARKRWSRSSRLPSWHWTNQRRPLGPRQRPRMPRPQMPRHWTRTTSSRSWRVCGSASSRQRGARQSVSFREHSVSFREHSVSFREHSGSFREHSVSFREHSVSFREHSGSFREHSGSFREHSVSFMGPEGVMCAPNDKEASQVRSQDKKHTSCAGAVVVAMGAGRLIYYG